MRRRKHLRSSARLLQRRWERSNRLKNLQRRKKESGQGPRRWKKMSEKREQIQKPETRLTRVRRRKGRTRSHRNQVECCSLAPSSSTWTRTKRMEERQANQRRMKGTTVRRNLYQKRTRKS